MRTDGLLGSMSSLVGPLQDPLASILRKHRPRQCTSWCTLKTGKSNVNEADCKATVCWNAARYFCGVQLCFSRSWRFKFMRFSEFRKKKQKSALLQGSVSNVH